MNETPEAGTIISFYFGWILWFILMAIDYNMEYFIYTVPGKFLNVQYRSVLIVVNLFGILSILAFSSPLP